MQFDEDANTGTTLNVTDVQDLRHAYHCVGAVWRTLLSHFYKRPRITRAIESMFLSKSEAIKENLPVEEVQTR